MLFIPSCEGYATLDAQQRPSRNTITDRCLGTRHPANEKRLTSIVIRLMALSRCSVRNTKKHEKQASPRHWILCMALEALSSLGAFGGLYGRFLKHTRTVCVFR